MNDKIKRIGLNAALVFLILCLTVFMISCRSTPGKPADPTDESLSAAVTQPATEPSEEPTEATEETEEPTEETEEPTEEPTEETTEPTEGTGGNTRPGGTGGFPGGGTGDDDTTPGDKEEDTITVAAPGTAENPYAEFFDMTLGYFTTVNMTAESPAHYNVYSANGATLTIENPDAVVVYNEVTYQAQDGILTLTLADDGTDTPVPMQLGTASTVSTAYDVRLTWPDGSEGRPYDLTVDGVPGTGVSGEIEPGKLVYYRVPGIDGTVLTVSDAEANIIYKNTVYQPENGIVTVNIAPDDAKRPVVLGIRNMGTAAKAFTLKVEYAPGSVRNPYPLQVGEMTTDFAAGNDQGVYYRCAPGIDGVVNVQYVTGTEGLGYEYLLLNEKTNDVRTLTSDGVTDEATGITTVSIHLGEFDSLLMIAVAQPGADGTYPAGQITTKVTFDAGSVLPEDTGRRTYTLNVTDEAQAPVADVKLRVQVGNLTIPMTTDASGNAAITLRSGTYQVDLIVPEGFQTETAQLQLTAEAPTAAVVLKVKGEETEPTDTEYTVTVTDYNGAAQANVMVQILSDGNVAAMQATDENGMMKATLPSGKYTVKLAFSTEGCFYDEAMAVLTADAPALQVRVASGLGTEFEELYVGNAYFLTTGGTYVDGMQTNVTSYFIFAPEVSGLYRFTTSNPAAVISFWGGSTAFIQDLTASTDYADNAFTRNVKETQLGSVCIIGVTGTSECIVEITRIGDAVLDESDIVPDVYEAKEAPKPFKLDLAAGQSLVRVDITAATEAYTLVLGADGYYHLGSETGPVMYVNLGPNAPYVSMYNMLGFTGFGGTGFNKTFYDANGAALRKEDYTACMCLFVENIDQTHGVYPLTEDLMYMFQQGGSHKGWWDINNASYLFTEVPDLNTEIAWMFACCYVQ